MWCFPSFSPAIKLNKSTRMKLVPAFTALFTSFVSLLTNSHAQDINAKLYISEILCRTATEGNVNDRDELYILVAGTTPAGQVSKRLPSQDNYYEFFNDRLDSVIRPRTIEVPTPPLLKRPLVIHYPRFTDRDQKPQGVPPIWNGTLASGQSAVLVVSFNEQDNTDWTAIKNYLAAVVAKVKIGDANLSDAIKGIGTPTKDNHIGTFLVTATNVNGVLKTRVDEVRDSSISARSAASHSVKLRGDGSYDVVLAHVKE